MTSAASAQAPTQGTQTQYPKPGTYEANEAAPRLFETSLYDGDVFAQEFPMFADERSETERNDAPATLDLGAQPQSSATIADAREVMHQSQPAAAIRQAPDAVVQKPQLEPVRTLVDDVPSASDRSYDKPTVAELRQARAQLIEKQRLERMERNLWYGYEPLRPNWNAIPMMHSRYVQPSVYVVPIYYNR
ncbi:hypothetical protein C2E31_11410 [Rhodopirellula baltica]|nr:hypothetical protein C2E31_11410 [Rhodopirellula baltica]